MMRGQHSRSPHCSSSSAPSSSTSPHTQLHRIAAYYIIACTFYVVIWSARLSILFSVIRIDSDPVRRKRILIVAALFGLVTALFIGQIFCVCEPEASRNGWKDKPNPQCNLGKQVAICQLVTDTIADTILLVSPLRVLKVLLDKGLRRRLMVIFSTCIVTTIVLLVHAAYIIRNGGPEILVAAVVENSTSLIVCSIPVVVSATFYARRSESHMPSEHLAISTFNITFSKRHQTGAISPAHSRSNNPAVIDITTVKHVIVSPRPEPWSFMDDSHDKTINVRHSKESIAKASQFV